MPTVRFQPDDVTIEVPMLTNLRDAAQEAGVPLTAVCKGRARCSTCRVVVESGLDHCTPVTEAEAKMSSKLHFSEAIRLACQTSVTGDVCVRRIVLDDEDIALTVQLGNVDGAGDLGEEKRAAILFADLRGSTPFAEALPPYDVIHTMNKYFLRMGRVIDIHGGYIESYRGDGLMALFGAADDDNDVSARAVRAALDMLADVERLNPQLEAIHGQGFEVVIGVHIGTVVVGRVGYGAMRQLSAVGDAVNLAARIEDVNKDVGAQLLVSSDVWDEVEGQFQVGRTFTRTLKGKTGDYTMYEVLG